MKATTLPIALIAAAALVAGCGGQQTESKSTEPVEDPALSDGADEAAGDTGDGAPAEPDTAAAELEAKSGSEVAGTVEFSETADGVAVTGEISGLEPGPHGFHVHEVGDCSADDGSSAGGHFNPAGTPHGGPTDAEHHVGDMGNITANDEGVAQVDEAFPFLTLADGKPESIVGRAVVVHAGQDDMESQPSGAAGARVACGIIAR